MFVCILINDESNFHNFLTQLSVLFVSRHVFILRLKLFLIELYMIWFYEWSHSIYHSINSSDLVNLEINDIYQWMIENISGNILETNYGHMVWHFYLVRISSDHQIYISGSFSKINFLIHTFFFCLQQFFECHSFCMNN